MFKDSLEVTSFASNVLSEFDNSGDIELLSDLEDALNQTFVENEAKLSAPMLSKGLLERLDAKDLGEDVREAFSGILSKLALSYGERESIVSLFSKVDLSSSDQSFLVEISEGTNLLEKYFKVKTFDTLSFEEKLQKYESVHDVNDIYELPILSRQEEAILAKKIEEGDQKAKEILIKANLRLVSKLSVRFSRYRVSSEDAFQYGVEGLMKAVDRFDYSKGFKFSTYATWWVRQSIGRHIDNDCREIRAPVHTANVFRKILSEKTKFEEENGYPPGLKDISEKTGYTKEKIAEVLSQHNITETISLYQTVSHDDESLTIISNIASDSETPEDELSKSELKDIVLEMLEVLTPRERDIVRMRAGFHNNQPMTLQEIGDKFNLSRERVRQIEKKAYRRLRVRNIKKKRALGFE